MIIAITLTEEEQEYLLHDTGTQEGFSIAAKIRRARCEEEPWEEGRDG
jgi:hypothetical protein